LAEESRTAEEGRAGLRTETIEGERAKQVSLANLKQNTEVETFPHREQGNAEQQRR
jgi:hypothetical protein